MDIIISEKWILKNLFFIYSLIILPPTLSAEPILAGTVASFPWWVWSLELLGLCFLLGILSVLAGIGGGLLYVPIVSTLFPFHIDFIRGAAMMVILTGALAASPSLLNNGLASLRLALTMAITGTLGALIGAYLGLLMDANTVTTALGIVIFGVTGLMFISHRIKVARQTQMSLLTKKIKLHGSFKDRSNGCTVDWYAQRTGLGITLFFVSGIISGMFGMGGGWVNVPVMSLLMGIPLKMATATSILVIVFNGAVSSWVYFNKGAVLPIIAVPSIAGMMLGSRLGATLLGRINRKHIRYIVSGVLLFAGIQVF